MQARADFYKQLGRPVLLYALLSTFFLYDNASGITVILFAAATILLCRRALNSAGISPVKESRVYGSLMILLAVSTALTGNRFIIFFNYVFMFLLVLCLLLRHYYPAQDWDLAACLSSLFRCVTGAVCMIGAPFLDARACQKERNGKKSGLFLHILIGLLLAVPFFIVSVSLLSSADIVFLYALRRLFQNWSHLHFSTAAGVLALFLFFFFSAYCGLRFFDRRDLSPRFTEKKSYSAVTAVTMLLPLTLVYLMFSVIQIVYLFRGNADLPDGYTYAGYARAGFFQLLLVSILNTFLVIAVQRLFREHRILKLFLTVISACTYIMIASSALRMLLYIRAYHLTFLRVLVLWALAVVTLFLAGVLIQIYRPAFPLFRYGVILLCVCYLLLSLSHADYLIARYNLQSVSTEQALDVDYIISGLSTDAAPALRDADPSVKGYFLLRHERDLTYDIRSFNLSHFLADRILNPRKL